MKKPQNKEVKYYDLQIEGKQQQSSNSTFHMVSILPDKFRESQSNENKFKDLQNKNALMNDLQLEVLDTEYYNGQQIVMKNLENSEESMTSRLENFEKHFTEQLEQKYQENLENNGKPDTKENKEIFMNKRMVSIKLKDQVDKKNFISQTYLRELEKSQSNYGYMIIKRKADPSGKAPTKFQLKFLDGNCTFEDENLKNIAEDSLYSEDLNYKQLQQKFIKKADKYMKGKINDLDYKNQEDSGVLNKRTKRSDLQDQDYDEYESFMGKKKKKNNYDSDDDF